MKCSARIVYFYALGAHFERPSPPPKKQEQVWGCSKCSPARKPFFGTVEASTTPSAVVILRLRSDRGRTPSEQGFLSPLHGGS